MAALEDLIAAQNETHSRMSKLYTNFQKLGLPKRSRQAVESRLSRLEGMWEECVERHHKIFALSTSKTRTALEYFTSEVFSEIEETYDEVKDSLYEAQASLPAPSKTAEPSPHFPPFRALHDDLQPIKIKPFTGKLLEWDAFRDLFLAVVDSREDLSNCQKLHHLKASVEGYAARLLDRFTMADAHYKQAWELLVKRYEAPVPLLRAYLDSFFAIPKVGSDRKADLRFIRDESSAIFRKVKALGRAEHLGEDLFVHYILDRFDRVTREAWEDERTDEHAFPNIEDVDKFLSHQLRVLRSTPTPTKNVTNSERRQTSKPRPIAAHQATPQFRSCVVCNMDHPLYQCAKFQSYSVAQRYALLHKQQRCTNCFRLGHQARDCRDRNTCRHCHFKHHTLLHQDKPQPLDITDSANKAIRPTSVSGGDDPVPGPSGNSLVSHSANLHSSAVLLPTATVRLSVPSGRSIIVRALFDQGSQATFVSEAVCQALRPKRVRTSAQISGVGEHIIRTTSSIAYIHISATDDPVAYTEIKAMVLPKLSSYVHPPSFRLSDFPHLRALKLADSFSNVTEPIQLIIGSDYYATFLRDGMLRGGVDDPIAQFTSFGWIITGRIPAPCSPPHRISVNHITFPSENDSAMCKFWELEEVPPLALPTEEEELCEQHFRDTHVRLPSGRYQVSLPFNCPRPLPIGDTVQQATSLFLRQESRLQKNSELGQAYHSFLQEYLDLGHMAQIESSIPQPADSSFLPHHPVLKPSSTTTKVRVVFNASFRSRNGTSLNDLLMVGPKLQHDLFALLLNWRSYKCVMTTDIEKMFRQIQVAEPDTYVQSIVWRSCPESDLRHFRLCTVTYGTACAPFLANRVLKQLALDEAVRFPLASPILLHQVYVDDVMFGADDIQSLKMKRDQLTALLTAGGFKCHKWTSNVPSLLSSDLTADNQQAVPQPLGEESHQKILGILWEPCRDVFLFRVAESPPTTTKRAFLSFIARFYDPLGWVAPVIIVSKILMQTLWMRGLSWDEPLPSDLARLCQDIQKELPRLEKIAIPRWSGQHPSQSSIEMHAFCDASNQAYATCIYLRVLDCQGVVSVRLLYAKTKVAPLKVQSIPRLELCGALLLSKAVNFVRESMQLTECKTYCWTDSTVVLSWLRSHPSRWKTFVANRVSKIQSSLPTAIWRHISTEHNPADCASRGVTATQLLNHPLWWSGPSWLAHSMSEWPQTVSVQDHADLPMLELRSVHTLVVEPKLELWDKFSSWPKLVRVTAYLQRFISAAKGIRTHASSFVISGAEFRDATNCICKQLQRLYFPQIVKQCNTKLGHHTDKTLSALDPFLDPHGILRVGGRLRNASMPDHAKFPVILPSCETTRLLIRYFHTISLHGGLQVTLRMLRERFWVLNARSLTKHIIRSCVTCVRYRAQLGMQKMGDLPAPRVTPSRPFSHTGLDYAGPFSIRASKGRGQTSFKGYIIIFVCLSVRAIHLECAADYSTAGFLAAFDRFVSRRGLPANLYSDNGPNFVGADRELSANLTRTLRDPDMQGRLAQDGINWNFIPPASPHFGGLWEAGVKSVKHHLRRVIGNFMPTFEEFATLLCKIEAVLNSRPIHPLHDDPTSYDVLTPGHFLIGAALKSAPTPSVLSINENRLSRWQAVQKIHEAFWRIWSQDYLNSLMLRRKWQDNQPNICIGDLVLIKHPNLPPGKWELARVKNVYPGSDGLVRVADLRTAHSEYKRPITQLCKLPIEPHTNSD